MDTVSSRVITGAVCRFTYSRSGSSSIQANGQSVFDDEVSKLRDNGLAVETSNSEGNIYSIIQYISKA